MWQGDATMRILKCRTNHIEEPIGFAMERVTVSWVAESECSKKQERSQITVALDPDMSEVIYQTGDQEFINSTGFVLPIEIKARTAYYWTVEVWGDAGDSAKSKINYFDYY